MGEFHNAEQIVEFDSEGRLHADDLVLSQVKNQQFLLHMEGDTVTLTVSSAETRHEPGHRSLSDIEDVEERMRVYEAFKKRVMRSGGATLPGDWETIRDSIYD